jgi:hypothetical protein
MRTHVKVVAALFFAFGGLAILFAIFAPLLMGVIATIVGSSGEHGAATGAAVLGLVGVAMTAFLLVGAVPAFVCGIGLLKYKSWARILGIILAAISLIKIPIGTLFGLYVLWVLFNKDTEALFAAPNAAPPAVPPTV